MSITKNFDVGRIFLFAMSETVKNKRKLQLKYELPLMKICANNNLLLKDMLPLLSGVISI